MFWTRTLLYACRPYVYLFITNPKGEVRTKGHGEYISPPEPLLVLLIIEFNVSSRRFLLANHRQEMPLALCCGTVG